MSLLSCSRNASVVSESYEKPITANCGESNRSLARLQSAGISLRLVRSPLAPKITIVHGLACCPCSSNPSLMFLPIWHPDFRYLPSLRAHGLLQMPAKLKPHRGQELRRKIVFAP